MPMKGRHVTCGTAILFALLASGCVPGMADIRDGNIRAEHAAVLLDGYEAYETLMSDADTDIVWLSYRKPDHISTSDVLVELATRIKTRDQCFSVAESSGTSTR